MPQYRKIYTKITQSFEFNDMPDDFTRLLWTLLPLGLDCEGRGIYHGSWIKSKIMPLRDDVTTEKIMTAMSLFAKNKMIVVYSTGGHDYFYIPTFKKYQTGTERETKSILPEPVVSNSRVTQELVESNSGVDQELVTVTESESAYESASVDVNYNIDKKFKSSDICNRIWVSIRGKGTMIPPSKRDKIEPVIWESYQSYQRDEDKTVMEGKKYFEDWCSRRSKSGAFYNPDSIGWVDWWANGSLPSNGTNGNFEPGPGGVVDL